MCSPRKFILSSSLRFVSLGSMARLSRGGWGRETGRRSCSDLRAQEMEQSWLCLPPWAPGRASLPGWG